VYLVGYEPIVRMPNNLFSAAPGTKYNNYIHKPVKLTFKTVKLTCIPVKLTWQSKKCIKITNGIPVYLVGSERILIMPNNIFSAAPGTNFNNYIPKPVKLTCKTVKLTCIPVKLT
jgi:hypothetical protein